MSLFNINAFVHHWGLIGIAFCIFAETGLFLGFFLPGESLLISAGIFASQGTLNIWETTIVVLVAGFFGNEVGYAIGRYVGPAFRHRPDGKIFKQRYLNKADKYFERYGNRTVLFARFVPIVRTFGPLVAGITKMQHRAFTMLNAIGGVIWTLSMLFLGYFLAGQLAKHGINVEKYILPLILVVVAISLIPVAIEIRRSRRESNANQTNAIDAEIAE